jgi:ribonuclease HI
VKHVTIHSDGGCDPNPGPGGWACVLTYGTRSKEISGGDPATTNNRMELKAAIEGLRALKERCRVDFFTDSEYVRKGITHWINLWKARNWKTVERKSVKNEDLWRELDEARARHEVTWHWLKGHAGHAQNERCDSLASQQIIRIRQKFTKAQLARRMEEFLAGGDDFASETGGLL